MAKIHAQHPSDTARTKCDLRLSTSPDGRLVHVRGAIVVGSIAVANDPRDATCARCAR